MKRLLWRGKASIPGNLSCRRFNVSIMFLFRNNLAYRRSLASPLALVMPLPSVFRLFFILIACFLGCIRSGMCAPLVLMPEMHRVQLLQELETYTPASQAVSEAPTPCQIVKKPWLAIRNTPCEAWFRITVVNPEKLSIRWHIAPKINRQETPTFFKVGQDGVVDEIPVGENWIRSVDFETPANTREVYLVRIVARNHEGIAFSAWSEQAFTRHTQMTLTIAMMVIGVLLAAMAYNLAISITNRDELAFWHATLLATLVAHLIMDNNLVFGFETDWNSGPAWLQNTSAYFLAIATINICQIEFKKLPFNKIGANILLTARNSFLLILPLQFIIETSVIFQIVRYLFLAPLAYMCLCGVSNLRRSIHEKKWELFISATAISMFSPAVFAVLIRDMGYTAPSAPFMTFLYRFIPISLALLMAISHAVSLRRLNKEKQATQLALLAMKEQSIHDLEKQVTIRTKQFKQEAEDAQRLRKAQQSLLGLVSHDLVTPLRGLVHMLEQLSVNTCEKGQRGFSLCKDVISEVVERVSYLSIQEVRQHYNQQLIRRPTPLHELAAAQIRLFSAAAQAKEIRLVNTLPQSTHAYVDSELFGEVLGNLLGNAIKFCQAKDQVTVGLRDRAIVVTDTGPGVSMTARAFLFKNVGTPSRGTAGERGFGLGLYSSRKIIEQHGGEIRYEDSPTGGSCFLISLPRYKPTICLVCRNEKTVGLRESIEQVLGKSVIRHTQGKDSIPLQNDPFIDLVICDCSEAQANGAALLAAFRDHEDWDATPIFMIGYSPASLEADALLEGGAQAVFASDFTLDTLRQAISQSDAGALLWASREHTIIEDFPL